MNKPKNTKGAVSVFLVIILVPCIVVTSLFVDLGRVHMSKSMANSSGDLALNSLMTNYDADLNEWYGMVASCQNIDEFYDISAKFFLRSLSSQNLSEDEIVLITDYYKNATSNDSISDLLQTDILSDTSGMVSAVDGANLSNATFIKDQVVEFMKYRAPIELTLGVIETFKKDTTTNDAATAGDNEALVDSKIVYYEAEGELVEAAFKTYLAIEDYKGSAKEKGFDIAKIKSYPEKLANYKKAYKEIHALTISNLLNTSKLSLYNRVTRDAPNMNAPYALSSKDIYSSKEKQDGKDVYYINAKKINSLLKELNDSIETFEKAKSNYASAASDLANNLPGTAAAQANIIQWWVKANEAVNTAPAFSKSHHTKVETAADKMMKAYSKVLAIGKYAEFDDDNYFLADDVTDEWKTNYKNLTSKVKQLHGQYLNKNATNSSDSYLKIASTLESISYSNINNIKSSYLQVNVNGQSLSVDNAIPHIKNDLSAIKSDMQTYIKYLDIAINGNEKDRSVADIDKVKSLDGLLELVEKHNSALSNWSNIADNRASNPQNTLASEDQEEIKKINQELCERITKTTVRQLKTRMENIKSQCEEIIEAIDSMKYGKKSIAEIGSYSDFKKKINVKSSEVKFTNQDLKSQAESTFANAFEPSSDTILDLPNVGKADYNPDLDKNTPELYEYLKQRFKESKKKSLKEQKDEINEGKDLGESKKKDAEEGEQRYKGGGEDITKSFSKDETFNLANAGLSSLMDLINSLINLNISTIRDDLYVTSYIMNMFSYATYENEGIYDLVANKTDLELSNYPDIYKGLRGGESQKRTWLSADLTDSYNKSLTNKLINKTNNAAYCAEVEYILCGGSNTNSENVNSVYSNIYGIRYVLNLVSGFQNFWSAKNSTAKAINTVAGTIYAASGGIIPAAAVKVVLIPILTIFETSKDLDRLEAGFPVEIYKKTHEDWWISIPDGGGGMKGFTNALSGDFKKTNEDKGIRYSDYLTIFVYIGLKSDAGEAMYQRIAEVIQKNMQNLTGNTGYSMEKAKLYFKLNAQIRVKPLMITLPYFNSYENDLETKTDWCTYDISITRGYS